MIDLFANNSFVHCHNILHNWLPFNSILLRLLINFRNCWVKSSKVSTLVCYYKFLQSWLSIMESWFVRYTWASACALRSQALSSTFFNKELKVSTVGGGSRSPLIAKRFAHNLILCNLLPILYLNHIFLLNIVHFNKNYKLSNFAEIF